MKLAFLRQWLKGECHFALRPPDPPTSDINLRQLQNTRPSTRCCHNLDHFGALFSNDPHTEVTTSYLLLKSDTTV